MAKRYTRKSTVKNTIRRAYKKYAPMAKTQLQRLAVASLKNYTRRYLLQGNIEKKYDTNYNTGLAVGKFSNSSATLSGHSLITVGNTEQNSTFFPNLAVGTARNQRLGDSVKITGMHIRFRFTPGTAYTGGGIIKIYIFSRKSDSVAGTTATELLDGDPMETSGTIITTGSSRNKNNYHKFIIHKVKKVYFPHELYVGDVSEFAKDVEFKLKLNKHLRYDKVGESTTNTPLYGDLGCLIVANFGNTGAASGNTGLSYSFANTVYYVDN